jgi:hypothetical protein
MSEFRCKIRKIGILKVTVQAVISLCTTTSVLRRFLQEVKFICFAIAWQARVVSVPGMHESICISAASFRKVYFI